MRSDLKTVSVPVDGGALAVEVAESDSAPLLAIHGVTSNCRLWNWLRASAPELSLVMPDLRGRAGSFGVSGRSSLRQHAEDLVRVLDALSLDTVDVCGMSMGGFAAVELATGWPDRVRGLVLVDGGLPMAAPVGLTPEMLPAAFTPQLGRLARPFEGVEEYLAYFTRNSPLLDPADPLLRDNLAHDLGSDGRVRLSPEAVLSDAEDVFFGESSWLRLTGPVELVCAEWSVGPDTPPAYPDEALAGFRSQLPTLREPRRIPGADHAATIMTHTGAAVVADAIRAVVAD
ncbi:alpha/beta hydrolase [Amycolatopsis sp. NBC_00345]|uniref:alpha/beta fold hydrolase n=1 Tax=Amycolatopsis sp. NBC_00345 TaxID=2975955 RepID=UPI002E25FD39